MSLLQHFYHLNNGDPNIYLLQDDFISKSGTGTTQIAGFTVGSTGTITKTTGTVSGNFITYPYNWKTPTTDASTFYVRFTELASSGIVSGTFDTWLSLASNQAIAVTATNTETISEATFDVEIAKNSDGSQVVARASMQLYADYIL